MVRVKLIEYTRNGDKIIASASKQTIAKKLVHPEDMKDEEMETWIIETFRRQHWSPWEFSHYTFLVTDCSRICSHQLVRHRHASFAQLSQRYSEGYLRKMVLFACSELGDECPRKPKRKKDYLLYARVLDKYKNIYGVLTRLSSNVGELEASPLEELASIGYVIPRHLTPIERAELSLQAISSTASYYRLLYSGVSKEDARFVLPQSVKTTLYVSMNARELVTVFLPLRMCSRAQWEIRELAWKIWRELVKVHPLLFKYTGPRCVMMENTSRGKPVSLKDLSSGKEDFTIPRCPELVPNKGIRNCIIYASRTTTKNEEIY